MPRQSGRGRLVRVVLVLTVLIVAGVAGCGPAQEPMFPVEGKVQFDGKPLTKATVIFVPDAGKNNMTKHEPRGAVIDGRYKMLTHPREGAPPGWYKVGVIAMEPSDPKNPYSDQRSLIPERFGKADESKLTVEVRKDASAGAYDLELK